MNECTALTSGTRSNWLPTLALLLLLPLAVPAVAETTIGGPTQLTIFEAIDRMEAGGDIDSDGIDEIVTGPGPSALFGAHVRGWNYDGDLLAPIPGCSFFAFSPAEYPHGVNVAVGRFWE